MPSHHVFMFNAFVPRLNHCSQILIFPLHLGRLCAAGCQRVLGALTQSFCTPQCLGAWPRDLLWTMGCQQVWCKQRLDKHLYTGAYPLRIQRSWEKNQTWVVFLERDPKTAWREWPAIPAFWFSLTLGQFSSWRQWHGGSSNEQKDCPDDPQNHER